MNYVINNQFASVIKNNHLRTKVILNFFVFFLASSVAIFLLYEGPHLTSLLSQLVFSSEYFDLPEWISNILYTYYVVFIIGSIFPFCLLVGWLVMHNRKEIQYSDDIPFVSVIIPAFNEEACISRCVEAAAKMDYPSYEIIVIDDGSDDFTSSLIENAPISFIKLRHNRGKFAALNEGIMQAKGDIVVFSDSDSWLHPQALRYLVRNFSDTSVGAVAGTVILDKPLSFLRCWQMLEYIFGQAFIKVAQIGSGSSVTICPGPIGAYRKDLLLEVGGFKERTLTEDFDATLDILQKGYTVCYESKAIAYTDSPLSWKSLMRQRLRWLRGNLQVLKFHKNIFFSPSSGLIGFFWLPFYFLFISYGLSFLEIIMLASAPFIAYFSGNPADFCKAAIVYFFLIEMLNVMQYIFALIISKQVRVSFIISAFFIMPYRLFLNWVKLLAVFQEAQRKELKWSDV